jgi:hypothetical protein
MHQTPDVIAMVLDSELVPDQFRNAGGGPQIRPVAVHHRPLQKKVDQTPTLSLVQLQWSSGRETYPQGIGAALPSRITPAHHRTWIAANAPAYFVKRVTRIEQGQGTFAPILEQVGTPLQSGHRCSAPEHPLLHYLCRYQ